MAVLANCWLIIEIHLIPDGFKKWFHLSFYIHPFFLFFCQILLWIKTLKRFIFFVTCYIFSHVFRVLRFFFFITRSIFGFGDGNKGTPEVEDSDEEDLWYEVDDSYSDTGHGILFLRYEAGSSREITKIAFRDDFRVELVDQETVSVCSSSDLDERSSSFSSGASSFALGTHRDMKVISHIPSSSSSSASPEDQEVDKPNEEEEEEEEKDSFYESYTERMSWFDLLNQERMCGVNAFLTKKGCSNVEKRILKSLESDIEMVYVAQSCLSWEALHDQYRKLEAMVASASADTSCTSEYGALITCTLATKFQRFQILLDRFMEDERCEKGKRYWNFTYKRSSLKSLLQVPQISENVHNEKEGRKEGLMIRATDVLKAIEKCMKSFKVFIEVDEKQSWWRASGRLSWNRSPLEDPRDSNLLHDLTRTLRQKELWMKDLKGKTRCWLRRRVEHLGDVQNKEMMFAMIELKLVARVLMMSVISTSQLQWCQQKLDNIEISHGRITRSNTGSLLFPPS